MNLLKNQNLKFRNFLRRISEEKKIKFSLDADKFQHQNFFQLRENFSNLKVMAHQPNAIAIESIKSKIKKSFFDSRWRQPGLQLPLPFFLGDGGMMEIMWEQKKQFLLYDLRKTFDEHGQNYFDVYNAFKEFIIERGLYDEFRDCMDDPVTLYFHVSMQHSKSSRPIN